jgi:hypothetical protein
MLKSLFIHGISDVYGPFVAAPVPIQVLMADLVSLLPDAAITDRLMRGLARCLNGNVIVLRRKSEGHLNDGIIGSN